MMAFGLVYAWTCLWVDPQVHWLEYGDGMGVRLESGLKGFGVGGRISHAFKNLSGESLPPREPVFFASISHALIKFGRTRSGAQTDLM